MPYEFNLNRHTLEVQWTLAWFPVRTEIWLDRPRMRAGVFRHSSSEEVLNSPGIGGGVTVTHMLGQATGGDEGLAPDNVVSAFVSVRLTHDGLFEVELGVDIPASQQRQRLVLEPDSRIPFMVTARSGPHEITGHTAITFHGVLATSARLGDKSVAAVLNR